MKFQHVCILIGWALAAACQPTPEPSAVAMPTVWSATLTLPVTPTSRPPTATPSDTRVPPSSTPTWPATPTATASATALATPTRTVAPRPTEPPPSPTPAPSPTAAVALSDLEALASGSHRYALDNTRCLSTPSREEALTLTFTASDQITAQLLYFGGLYQRVGENLWFGATGTAVGFQITFLPYGFELTTTENPGGCPMIYRRLD